MKWLGVRFQSSLSIAAQSLRSAKIAELSVPSWSEEESNGGSPPRKESTLCEGDLRDNGREDSLFLNAIAEKDLGWDDACCEVDTFGKVDDPVPAFFCGIG